VYAVSAANMRFFARATAVITTANIGLVVFAIIGFMGYAGYNYNLLTMCVTSSALLGSELVGSELAGIGLAGFQLAGFELALGGCSQPRAM
jgi:hypothetical protein